MATDLSHQSFKAHSSFKELKRNVSLTPDMDIGRFGPTFFLTEDLKGPCKFFIQQFKRRRKKDARHPKQDCMIWASIYKTTFDWVTSSNELSKYVTMVSPLLHVGADSLSGAMFLIKEVRGAKNCAPSLNQTYFLHQQKN